MRTRYIQVDGELVEVGQDFRSVRNASVDHNVIPDIEPYQSMIDGSLITSRRKHREHLRAHGCVEVGNERLTPRADLRKTGAKEALVNAVQQAKAQHGSRKVELAISDALNKAHELRHR